MKLFSPKRRNLFNEEEKKSDTRTELAVVPGEEAKFVYATEEPETDEVLLSDENIEIGTSELEEPVREGSSAVEEATVVETVDAVLLETETSELDVMEPAGEEVKETEAEEFSPFVESVDETRLPEEENVWVAETEELLEVESIQEQPTVEEIRIEPSETEGIQEETAEAGEIQGAQTIEPSETGEIQAGLTAQPPEVERVVSESKEETAPEAFTLKRPNEDFEVSSESGFIELSQQEKEFTPEPKAKPRRKRRKELLISLGEQETTQVLHKIDLKDESLVPIENAEGKTIVVDDVEELRLDIQRRVKQSKRILRRREKSGREIIETRTKELTQNLDLPVENNNSVYSNVPDYVFDGGITLYNSLIRQMEQNGTLKVETLMSVLGALAGFSTQMAVREKMVNRMGIDEDQVFSIIKTQNEKRYFFADTIDQLLQKDKHSVWYMSASATMRLSGRVESSIEEIIRYSVRNLGKESFGVPRLTNQTRPPYLPEYFVEKMWYGIQEGLERFTNDPLEWPQIFGIAVQRALLTTKGILDTNTSLRIMLECAVPMSMIDLVPVKPEVLSQQEMEDVMIERLHNEIEVLRNTLYMADDEEREELLLELSQKTEQLYVLIENKSQRLKK